MEKDLDARREEARQAMETSEHKAAREAARARLATRRQEARRAMEDERRRAARLAAEKAERAVAEQRAAAAAQAAANEEETARRAAAAVAAAAMAETKEAARLKQAENTGNLIERLRQMPEINLEPVRTLKRDMESTVEKKETSLASIAIAEQARRIQTTKTITKIVAPAPKVWRRRAAQIIFILLATGAGVALYWYRDVWPNTVIKLISATPNPFAGLGSTTRQSGNKFVRTDETLVINLNDTPTADLAQAIAKSRSAASTAPHGLTAIEIVSTAPVTPRFLHQRLGWKTPEDLLTNLEPDWQTGWYQPSAASEPPTGWLILRSKQFERALAGLRAWESNLPDDLLRSWRIDTGPLPTPDFRNQLKNNLEIREALIGGVPRLVYGFVNEEIVVIAETAEALTEITRRILEPLAEN